MSEQRLTPTSKYIIAGKQVIELRPNADGLWVDLYGTVFALTEESAMTDPRNRCGVGWASLPEGSPLNELCRPHDYAYSCPAYQLYHNRSEADEMLAHLIKTGMQENWRAVFAFPFKWLANIFGGRNWENKDTRNK